MEKMLKVGDHQAELILRNKPVDIIEDFEYAKLLSSPSDEKLATSEENFFRLKLPPEEYRYAEYYYPENEPYRVYFHNVCNHWFVYKTYQRVNDISIADNFNAKAYYMGMIPNDIMDRGDFHEINDFLSTVSVLHGEHHRKLELQYKTGGAFRPTFRSMKCRKVALTYRASYARQKKNEPAMLKILIGHCIDRIKAYQRGRLRKTEELLNRENDIVGKLKAFTTHHKHWFEARKKMCNYAALQHKVRRTVPFKRYAATKLVALNDTTPSDLCNELIDYPTWAGFHYYMMRVINKNGLKIVYDDINYAVEEDTKLRHLRVMPSKYAYSPQPTTVFGAKKVYSQKQIPLDHWPLNDYPPSIASVSGYSTISQISTATTSPNSWQNDWKMQPRHDEYDHRLTETTIPNVRDSRARGAEQFAARFNKEINNRIDLALADIEAVMSTTLLNSKMDPRVVATSDSETVSDILDRHGDLTWLKKAEERINQILSNDELTVEDKKDLQVLYYAKQRYDRSLSKYNLSTICNTADEPQTTVPKTISDAIKNSSRTKVSNLYINDSWRRIVDSNRIPPNALRILKLLITDRDAWPLDSDFSNIALVDRADRISIPHVVGFFHRYHLSESGTKFLAIGTLVLIIIFLFLFSFFLAYSQANLDMGYCPSNIFGFDPNNPYQAEMLRNILEIKSATKYKDPHATATHFFMLPE